MQRRWTTAWGRRGRLRLAPLIITMTLLLGTPTASAIEGTTAAGPVGGSDVRVALLPPPGFYGGVSFFAGNAPRLVDGNGNDFPGLSPHFTLKAAAPFFLYVPDVQLFGGSIGVFGVAPYGAECGRFLATQPWACAWGAGDPYVEIGWWRYFGTPRPSRVPGSFPILEGLAVSVGVGAVFPVGQYNVTQVTQQGIGVGNNIFDIAPAVAVTYTTPPIFAEATEISAKVYWNMYRINPATQYQTADFITVNFAVTERYGRYQLGVAGTYAFQFADDKQFGVKVPPDGRRSEVLLLGGVFVYDMPEYAMSAKIKAVSSVIAANAVRSQTMTVSFIKKFD
jgi:hypothetical protein